MGNPLFAKKTLEMLLTESKETGEHSLKRALGPVNLITLGIGAPSFSVTSTFDGFRSRWITPF